MPVPASNLGITVTKVADLPDPNDLAASNFPGDHSGGIANNLYPQPQVIPPFGLYRVEGNVVAEIDSFRGMTQFAGNRTKFVSAMRRNRRDALILQRQIERQTPPRL